MISLHVSAVLLIRDGFTGQAVEGSGLFCTLNGMPVRPVVKPGGYLVLVDLPEGLHQLGIKAPRFQDERVDIPVEKGKTINLYPVLKPGAGYFVRRTAARVTLKLTGIEGSVWLSPPGSPECKLAQAKAAQGASELRVFCKGGLGRLPIPGPFLLEDGKKSEIIVLESCRGERVLLADPLAREHGRNRRLLPAGQYRIEQGALTAVFPQPGEVFVLCPGREGVQSAALAEGDNEAVLTWK